MGFPFIIGFAGEAQSGKDTAGKYLAEQFSFTKLSFADKLKRICKEMFDLSEDQLETNEGKSAVDERYGVTPRHILQFIGTDSFRSLYPTVWADYIARVIDKAPRVSRFVITDVRFQDEADLIRARGGVIVKVVREDHQDLKGEAAAHKSEQFARLPDEHFDYVIRAKTGEMDLIYKIVKAIFQAESQVKDIRSSVRNNSCVQDIKGLVDKIKITEDGRIVTPKADQLEKVHNMADPEKPILVPKSPFRNAPPPKDGTIIEGDWGGNVLKVKWNHTKQIWVNPDAKNGESGYVSIDNPMRWRPVEGD